MTSSSGSGESQQRLSGWLNKVESRPIGAVGRRRCWCVASVDTPVLFWYKADGDLRPIGRVPLSSATFNFNPHVPCQFEIRVNDQTYVFEAESGTEKLKWLKHLQAIRRKHRGIDTLPTLTSPVTKEAPLIDFGEDDTNSSSTHAESPTQPQTSSSATSNTPAKTTIVSKAIEGTDLEQLLREPESDDQSSGPTFYISPEGRLNELSWIPPEPSTTAPDSAAALLADVSHVVSKVVTNATTPTPQRLSIRLPSFKQHKACQNCQELLAVVNQLKDRCHDLHDEVAAGQNMVDVLRQSVMTSKNQVETLTKLSSLADLGDRVKFILEREKHLTAAQLDASRLNQQYQRVLHQLHTLDQEHQQALSDVEAYKDSIRTKEQLIIQLVGGSEDNTDLPLSAIEADGCHTSHAIQLGTTSAHAHNTSVPETMIVNDYNVEQLRDLVAGFETQNLFLNQEILDLQATIRKLEDDQTKVSRRNFDLEADYYQLKSKYVLLLNHLQSDDNRNALSANTVTDLIRLATSSNTLTPSVKDDDSSPESDNGPMKSQNQATVYDSLGFYMKPRHQRHTPSSTAADLVNTATELNRKADDLRAMNKQEQSAEYVAWLNKWDSFLVSSAHKPITPTSELKLLVRTGIPHTYRARVWESIVTYWVKDIIDDVGKGYFDSLCKRNKNDCEYDGMLKQIDLDLPRTLPGNKHFEDPDSDKMADLRKVLYAFRYHNPQVGYCQGLNRLAAIALLYLDVQQAFWFVVAAVEFLQPVDYYSTNLIGAIVDQKVLQDLVHDKLPKVSAQFRHYEVDLSLFTLSWFITCFVDALPYRVYLKIIDCFLYEQNKVLFRFALALLKIHEKELLACRTAGGLHSCLSHLCDNEVDWQTLQKVAFDDLNPLSLKYIDARRQHHRAQLSFSAST